MAAARDVKVRRIDGTEARLIDLDTWTLVNLKIDDLVALPYRIAAIKGLSLKLLSGALKEYSVQNIGILDFYQALHVRYCPHASRAGALDTALLLAKAATLLGLGQNNVLRVKVDLRARMDVPDLVKKLRQCLVDRIPVLAVVAVIGSTEESAVIPFARSLMCARSFARRGSISQFTAMPLGAGILIACIWRMPASARRRNFP